jgi:excisionase family DNA binding protein
MSTTVMVYTPEQVARLLNCSVKTVEQMARDGALAGVKPGGGWLFPAGALAKRLDELALEQAADRRKPAEPVATTVQPQTKGRGGRRDRTLPKLVPMGSQA